MTGQEKALVDKKPSELTTDEIRALMKPVGIPGLPYPMAQVETDANGAVVRTTGLIQSAQNPMIVYTEQSIERVNGKLFREMPIPGMMFMLRDLLKKMGPEANNRIMTVFGDAAFGKSHLFRLVGGIVHPKGPLVVDCGGMNMRELFFRTIIDYGEGVKEQLDQRVAAGKIKDSSLDMLEGAFPGSVVRNGDRTAINWDAVGARRAETVEQGGKSSTQESYEEAADRASKVLKLIYEREGITFHHNSFGIKTVPGEILESIREGRPIFLDEFNKSKKGTLDSFQTFLQLANGEIDHVSIQNPMATGGDDNSPKSVIIRREDLAVNWFLGIAGNDAADGDTTQELSVSMTTRLNPMRVGDPSKDDWAHRISQVWTGLPLVTLYNLFEATAKAKPAEFSNFLVGLRKLGLTAEEQKAIPPHEIYFLQNFQDTVQAVNQTAKYYADRLKLADPESEMFGQKAYQDLSDEVASGYRKIHVSFRQVIADYNKALQAQFEVRPASEATLALNLAEAFRSVDLSSVGRGLPGWHSFGKNLANVIKESIANDTIGMPKTAAALMELCVQNGILAPQHKEAKASKDVKPIAELMKYDSLKDLGGTEELLELRGVLMATLRDMYPKIKQADDLVMPLENLGRALQQLEEGKSASPHSFVLPNDDLNSVNGAPMVEGVAIPNFEDDRQAGKSMVLADFRSALAALAVPDYAQNNRKRIWLHGLSDIHKPSDTEEEEAFATLEGRSKIGFDLGILAVADVSEGDSKQVHLYVIEDKIRNLALVVGPRQVAPQLQAALSKNGITYLVKEDEATEDKINDFLSTGAHARGVVGGLEATNTSQVIEGLIRALSASCDLSSIQDEDSDPDKLLLAKGSTFGKVIRHVNSEPNIYTSIMRPKTPGK